jgi:hypothetical protein
MAYEILRAPLLTITYVSSTCGALTYSPDPPVNGIYDTHRIVLRMTREGLSSCTPHAPLLVTGHLFTILLNRSPPRLFFSFSYPIRNLVKPVVSHPSTNVSG